MVSIKKIFGSSSENNAEDGGDLRHGASAGRSSLDRSGKETEARSKNDELASRLGKKSNSDLGHKKSLSGSSTSGPRTEAQRKNDELASGNTPLNNQSSSTEGYNTGAHNTSSSHDNRSSGIGPAGSALATGAGVGAGAGALSGSSRDGNDLENTRPHATLAQDGRPIVGTVPVHQGGKMESINNPSFVLPADAAATTNQRGLDSAVPQTGLGQLTDHKRDDSNKEAFHDPSHHRNTSGTTGVLPTTGATTSPTRGNLERTGTGRLSSSQSGRGFAGASHEDGHLVSAAHHEFDPKLATHDHQHLQHVTHREVRHVEVEEVERIRDVDRHIHHVQTHIQPVLDKEVLPEKISENIIAPTKVHERHASTAEDVKLFESLATQHHDTETHRAKERTIVDLGEKVVEKVHHHVHHVTQPVIEQEIVERHRIHTVIPVHHVTHEAPIIHKSSTHAPVALADFLKGGGVMNSSKTYDNVGLLPENECERSVDGVAEKLIQDLNLRSSHSGEHSHGLGSSTHSNHGTSSTTGNKDYVSKDGDHHNSKVGQVFDNATPADNKHTTTNQTAPAGQSKLSNMGDSI